MYNRLIMFFFRRKFGLKKCQHFVFTNQTSKIESYYFTSDKLMKYVGNGNVVESKVKLNWLMNDECKIEKLPLIGG